MSLRRKLTLFFLGIVVLPVLVLAYLLIDLSRDARQDRAEAELRAGMLSVGAIYDLASRIAPQEADRLADRLARPLSSEDAERVAAIAKQELAARTIASITVRDEQGRVLQDIGPERALTRAVSPIRTSDGKKLGSVEVMTIDSRTFLSRIDEQTDQSAAIVKDGKVVTATNPVSLDAAPLVTSTPEDLDSFEVDASTGEDIGAALDLAAEPGDAKLLLLSDFDGGLLSHPLTVIGSLVLLLIVALGTAALMLNRLRRRLNEMLAMTRRIGQGDFSGGLSEDGNDEMAELAREINRMRGQISAQIEELRAQRRELDESVRRLGDAFASGLDREALLEVLVETATAACGARRGQVIVEGRAVAPTVVTFGADPGGLTELLSEASAVAVAESGSAAARGGDGSAHAIAEVMDDPERRDQRPHVVAVARDGEPFTEAEAEALHYLIGQCAVSIENIVLHEQVARQAVTDDLTGLANHRALNTWLEREIQRVHRYGEPLSLLIVDIDEFKRINDSFGHPEGDQVLRRVAAVIQRESRGVDEAARYGGDEFVLALPGTAASDAREVAERIRHGIAEIEVLTPDDGLDRISASIGVAGTEAGILGASELLAAADAALYEAKAGGKDRVTTATDR